MNRAAFWMVRTWRRLTGPARKLARLIFPGCSQGGDAGVGLYTATEPIPIPDDIDERVRLLALETRRRFERGDHFLPLLRAAQSGAEIRAELTEDYNGQSAPQIVIALPCPSQSTCAEDSAGSMTNRMKITPASSRAIS